jgi:transposase
MDATLPNELSTLRELVSQLQGALCAAQMENKLLRQKLELFLKRYFGGSKNEGLDPKQLELLLAGLEAAMTVSPVNAKPASPVRRTETARPVRQPLPAHLETERVVLEPAEVQQQPEGWRKLGEEVTEELDWKPAKFIKRLYVRPKYAKAERIVIAPLPARLIEKGLPGAALMAQVLVSKYEDHQPLYRQQKIYERCGVKLPRQTMGGWVEVAADWVSPIYREMKSGLISGHYLQADETPIRYLDPDVKGKSQQGWLWTYRHPHGDVVFEWNVSRSREGPRQFLKDFKGKLQTDGFGVYESLARERNGELVLIGCWAHVRRGFHEALGEGRGAAWIVGQIGQLYAVEKTLREHKAGPALRAAVRIWQSRPVLARLRKALEVIRRRVLPKSLLGQAIDYTLSRWEALTRYLDDGHLEIDNNLVENAIRPTALGKKNFLFIGHPGAGQRSAVIYSILGSCRRLGINPAEYLQDIFERLPKAKTSEIKSLTPSAWLKAKRASARKSA